ncbi:MAG TPA: NUDIX hydrolase [Burkholderiales bacterium]
MSKDDFTEHQLDSTQVYDGRLLKVYKDNVRLPDDSRATREYIKHPGAVAILAVLPDGKVLLERQYRYPHHRDFIEIPAGKIDPGEDILNTAKRELLEETGYTATEWRHLTTIHPLIAYSDEVIELFLAQGLTPGERSLDPGEFLEVMHVDRKEALNWVLEGKIDDAKSMVGLMWLDKLERGDWS